MEKEKSISNAMSTSLNLDKNEGGQAVDESKYWGMISYLVYLIVSRPNFMFVICLCALFQVNPQRFTHLCSQTHYEVSHYHTTNGFIIPQKEGLYVS